MANVTSAFSTITGNYSSVFSSFKELEHNRRQLWIILPLVFAGSIIGAFLLFAVPSKWFAELVPLCIALAGIILLFPIIRNKVRGRWQEIVNYLVNHGSVNFYQSLVFLLSGSIQASLMPVPEC